MSEDTSPVLYAVEGPVATLRLNRPRALNAFDADTIRLFGEHARAAAADASVRVLVVRGSGRAFCAGGDLAALKVASAGEVGASLHELAGLLHEGIEALYTMEKPVLAAVNGAAAGAGFSLALACDLRVMAASAFFQQAYTSNGLCVDGGGTYTLPRLIGQAKALEFALLDPRVPAEEALRLGLASAVVADEDFDAEVDALATKLAGKAVGALGRVKRLVQTSLEADLVTRLGEEQAGIVAQATGPEGQEGIAAFLEKRKPRFLDG